MVQSIMDSRNVGSPVPVAQPNSWWSEEEIDELKKLWPHELDYNIIENKLPGRTLKAINCKAVRLKLKRPNINDEIMAYNFEIDRIATDYVLQCLEEYR